MAAPVALAAVVAVGRGGLHAEPQTPPAAPVVPTTQARSPRNASYAINVRLDPASRTLKGDELLTWRNITTTPATSLRFHLYYNAWRNTASTWIREHRLTGADQLESRPQADWGWIDVTSLRLIAADGTPTDLTSNLRFIAPDDGNQEDATVGEVPLAVPVQPGQTVNVQIAWSSRVPRTFARTGVVGDFYFLAQWFPKIGVLESDGWNCHQFHAGTEFFSDFGVYDVRLTVPNGWIVGATGRERARRDEGDGTTTHNYYAEDVHDFAWTTSPDYVERTATFEDARLPAVSMRLLLQPEHVSQAERHFQATRATLKLLRRMVRSISVRPHHDRGSGLAERGGRHGVSDALHRRHKLARAAARRGAGRRDGARSRPSVLVRPGGDQRVRTRVDGRRVQHVLDRANARSDSSSRPSSRSATSAASSPGRSRTFR